MLPRHLLALSFSLIFESLAYAYTPSSFLSESPVRKQQVQNVLEHEPVTEAVCERHLTGPIETTLCDYETIESVNDELFNQLHALVETPFFKYFRVDLYRDCPYWEENGFCANRECGITTVDESEIPEKWRAAALSKLEKPSKGEVIRLPGCYYRDSDYCFLDDPLDGDYVDLTLNPERFTGYIGPSAHRVWSAIYSENCFGLSQHAVLNEPVPDIVRADGECLEQRVYYKIISGLHTSISTHICHDMMDQTTGQWGPDLQCFINRVAAYPERLQYLYFDVVLLLRAVARLGPYLSAYDYCGTDDHEKGVHLETHERLERVIDVATAVGKFDETVLFRGENANVHVEGEFKEHFRNVTRIMDCVGCDKCRLWGKVQTTGVATALKVLFELDEKALDPSANPNLLQRSEVVALINTLHRFSESLAAVNDFRKLWAAADAQDEERMIEVAASAAAQPPRSLHSPVAGKDTAPDTLLADLWYGTVGCVRGLVEGLGTCRGRNRARGATCENGC
ncbi:endoplasmic oxidoreductin [Fomitopsis serialis]|uniref:endoplasmic oxidoreductin n=1 Tax=Fomitopsis serialis TaxID=139415 RepID=UPI002008B404|nr:endoplasmic oxidoreductin [Neoantrodia serialis]KAH9935323.1 endoplasmic oxidoreductin [Neoantrodia serialis]